MKFVLCVSLGLLLVDAATSTAAVTVCPKANAIQAGSRYHADSQCDRTAYNHYKTSLGRHLTHQKFKKQGGIRSVPNQKTVTCPAAGARVSMGGETHETNGQSGMDTVWFVENQASTPVVVAYVSTSSGGGGVEVSARNPEIAPAAKDPNAILLPGRWMAVYAYEGHEFVVRELLTSGVAGNVLLQYRAGLIPIGLHAQHNQYKCPETDLEPKVNETHTAPAFARTTPQVHRPCHTMDVGFRNLANCPLHGYYVRSGPNEQQQQNNATTSCTEHFKLHLGVQDVVPDYLNDWTSQTKYEGTFIGHTFHFRLAANPTVLVDTVTLSPVVVTDCPLLAKPATTTTTTIVQSQNVLTHLRLGSEDDHYLNTNSSSYKDFVANAAPGGNRTDAYYYHAFTTTTNRSLARHAAAGSR